MKLTLMRFDLQTNYTIGRLSVDGAFECYTLEDTVRPPGVKVSGATAIPAGAYAVTIDESQRFGRKMPHILDVPGFAGIRIHSGNTAADTEGCILVGKMRAGASVQLSRAAFDALFPKLEAALAAGGPVTIEIADDPQELTP